MATRGKARPPNVLSRRGCFNCGAFDHNAVACPSAEKLCYNCKSPDHAAVDCPEPRKVEMRQCLACKGIGHLAKDCPSLKAGTIGPKCYKCGRRGHFAKNCENEAGDGDVEPEVNGEQTKFGAVGSRGGFRGRGGSTRGRGRGRGAATATIGHASLLPASTNSSVVCYKCGELNHVAANCTWTGPPVETRTCYNCGEQGHLGKNCLKASTDLDDPTGLVPASISTSQIEQLLNSD